MFLSFWLGHKNWKKVVGGRGEQRTGVGADMPLSE